jgi:hypothetical protein
MAINEIEVLYTPSIYGRTSFPLKHKFEPIFYKVFDGENPNVVNIQEDLINIPNHFFKTGEPLKYNFDISPIQISSSSPGANGIITEFPNIIYPIVVDSNNIRISLGSTYAQANQYVDITSLGIGTQHSLEAFKQNSKCLIEINNIIQSPISVGSTVKVLGYAANTLTLENLENIKVGNCLRINGEIARIFSINYDTNTVGLTRGANVLGTDIVEFSNSLIDSYIDILSGNYNIIKDVIYFDDPPLEGKKIKYNLTSSDIIYDSYSFNLLSNDLRTGSQVYVFWTNPPRELANQQYLFIIKNSDNNFSFAKTYPDSLNGIKIQFSNITDSQLSVSDFQIIYYYPNEDNTFSGRVFLKSNYDGNAVFDDISEQFTGITSSFELKTSGISTVGISSDNGILLVNNIFQYPGSDEVFSFVGVGTTGTSINFVGFGTTGFIGKTYDVNVKGYPRGGIIVSYGTTSGTNYQLSTSFYNVPLVGSISGIGASVSFSTDEYGNVNNFKFTNHGYNYKIGEILVPTNASGLGTQTEDDKIHITINEVTKDTFNAWDVGILQKLDDLSSKANGKRRTFNLTKDGKRISLDADQIYEIELQYNLLIFINDVLQTPKSSYIFDGGSIVTFTEPIPTGSNVKIYFYKGYYNDTYLSNSLTKLKEADVLQVAKDIYNPFPLQEKERVIKEFINSDTLRTNVYSDVGISTDSSKLRSITWTPQKVDKIIDGTYFSKSRDEQNSNVTLFNKITQYLVVGINTIGISTTTGTFVGLNTNFIGINTSSGIGTLIQIGDYVEGNYVGIGVTIVSIGSSTIGIGSTNYSSSPSGINTSMLSFYRKP